MPFQWQHALTPELGWPQSKGTPVCGPALLPIDMIEEPVRTALAAGQCTSLSPDLTCSWRLAVQALSSSRVIVFWASFTAAVSSGHVVFHAHIPCHQHATHMQPAILIPFFRALTACSSSFTCSDISAALAVFAAMSCHQGFQCPLRICCSLLAWQSCNFNSSSVYLLVQLLRLGLKCKVYFAFSKLLHQRSTLSKRRPLMVVKDGPKPLTLQVILPASARASRAFWMGAFFRPY